MGWLEAIVISGLEVFFCSLIGLGIVCLFAWAVEKNKDIEVFLAVVMIMVWGAFAFILKMG